MSEEIKDIMDALENNELKNDGFWGRACSRLSQQLLAAKEENEKLKECFIPLNQKKYYCSKEVYNILEDTNNEWQRVSQLESERVMEIIKLERENKYLTQQNKQMMENINNIKNLCNEDWEDMTVDKFQNQLLQALNEENNEK